ncbi:MAG: UDP-N-acetylglucosamine--N-acetylmuramyl-(pentapeptide) pyrophosphoryl-undecaprenol N-acetylglucosamine transferase [uncultured Thermomicrobiales bacterium]|uniref:UDP-N-acetylglucosamine--N-acetylmuramyl-(pentapeptide) pyrophosphoryl-undecaprenol N-acetylglucosamine transferase n=1 Tax=uncultured Thermomicrobiales bacterium TaxID=1645740 RepID=A0A6J4UC08_9BACT|nr:MAG: UDP-N-acetylglucosamine--N-acetylmuramyl-(pentapeptide) pyrophosphoryl-undecaprenol N-acetylglucosamine transferase [uncultured Thermomicrobiales bacterium]
MVSTDGSLRLVIAGGGTGGHVLPAVAVIEELRRRGIMTQARWIGSHTGVERVIAAEQEVEFIAIQTGKLRRYLAIQTVTDGLRVPVGVFQAWRHIRSFQPDVIYSTGGAVSVPSVVAGHRIAPVITHEQTAQIGIANRTAARFASTFAVGFEQTAIQARAFHQNVVTTGNPVRASLASGSAERGYDRYGFTPGLPVVYVTGGARGASPLNQRIEPILTELLEKVQLVHQVGPASANNDLARLRALRDTLPQHQASRYVVTDFVGSELPDLYAIADLVVGRAGAGTVSELGFMGLPSILIPLPGTWGDEQRKNARVLGDAGGAVVIDQTDATSDRLRSEILVLAESPQRRQAMTVAARSTATPDAAARLVDEILTLTASRPKRST